MRSSLKIFETVFHFSHSSFAIDLALILHFAISFHHSWLISLLNLLGPLNWTPHLQYFPSSKPGYPLNGWINLPKLPHSMCDDWLFQKSELLSLSIQNVHSLALPSISRFISCNSRISLQFLKRCLMLSHLLILAHNLPTAWDALPFRGCISTYAPAYLMNRLTIYIWIFKELKSHGKRI